MVIPRGPVEAAGVGLKVGPGDVALRCNFATVAGRRDGLRLIDRRAGRINSQTTELAEALTTDLPVIRGVRAVVRAATEHRCVMLLRGSELSAGITDVDPGDQRQSDEIPTCKPLDAADPAAKRTAEVVNGIVARSYQIMRDHPVNRERVQRGLAEANILLPRKAGMACELRGLLRHLAVSAAVVSGEATVFGLARLLGLDSITERAFTGNAQTDLPGKARAALAALEQHDLVYLHVKATDTLSHDGNAQGKMAFLERIDQAFAPILQREDLVVCVAADHSTPCTTGRHSGDPVPVILCSPQGRRDAVTDFGETPCMRGGLGVLSFSTLLWAMLDQMGFTRNVARADLPFVGEVFANVEDEPTDTAARGNSQTNNLVPLR
jgi:2,3-bisphosphoglycerate-independent phosphoglycerate mutase